MKTTKKGFTLIELIVVIAIIGVLAALLIPAMLGYVKKSKIQGANSAASTWLKNVNTALEEMDEDDIDVTDGEYGHIKGSAMSSSLFEEYVAFYSDDAKTATYAVYVDHGVAVAAAAKNGKYYGCTPGAFSNKTYDNDTTLQTALQHAVDKYAAAHTDFSAPTISNVESNTGTFVGSASTGS